MSRQMPISEEMLQDMKQHEFYHDMVERYGEEVIHNNIEVDYILLTEGEDIITENGTKIDITRYDTDYESTPIKVALTDIFNATKVHWYDYLANPVNTVKSWFDREGKGIGYIPIITNHKKQAENEHGFILGNSLKLIETADKMALQATGILISPVAKWNHTTGLWRKVSPTFAKSTPRIIETSYVTIPAQVTNTSMSSGDAMELPALVKPAPEIKLTDLQKAEMLEKKIRKEEKLLKKQLEKERKIQEDSQCKQIVSRLHSQNLISSGQKQDLYKGLLALSSGDFESGATNLIKKIVSSNNSPFINQPKVLYLKGNPMSKQNEKESMYLQFKQDNRHSFPDGRTGEEACNIAFESHYSTYVKEQEQMRLSSGDLVDPKDQLTKAIDLIKQAGLDKDPAIVDQLKVIGYSLSSGDGETQSAGTVENANNTKLNDGDMSYSAKEGDEPQKKSKKGKMKKKLKKMKKELKGLKNKPSEETKPSEAKGD